MLKIYLYAKCFAREPFALRPFEYSQSWGAAVLFKECFEKANRQSDIREMGRELSEIHDSFL